MYSTYPSADDLQLFIESLGVINPTRISDVISRMNLPAVVREASSTWEDVTGWKPFLGDTVDVTRYFDPPGSTDMFQRGGGRILEIENTGILTVTSCLIARSSMQTGIPLIADQDFYLEPYNAPLQSKPYTRIEFVTHQWGLPKSLAITGRWGYSLEIDEQAWNAILRYGAYLVSAQLSLLVSRGIYSIRDLNSEVRYAGGAVSPLALEAKRWSSDFFGAAYGDTKAVL